MVTQKQIDQYQWLSRSRVYGDSANDLVSCYCLRNDLFLPDELFVLICEKVQDVLDTPRPEWMSQENWDLIMSEDVLLEKVGWFLFRAIAIQAYLEKQREHYRQGLLLGNQNSAQDALWRAASEADLLTQDDYRDNDLPPSRMAELITLLGW